MPHTRKSATHKPAQPADSKTWIPMWRDGDGDIDCLSHKPLTLGDAKRVILAEASDYDGTNGVEYFLLDVSSLKKVKYTPTKVEVV